ncbi:MAG: hypothetical protein M3Z04_07665 [Chloroflexota bacterium]|nr:hypothetical protein [Chloroflexota bacterium]
MQAATDQLHQLAQAVSAAAGALDWEARHRAGVDGDIAQARQLAQTLAGQADTLAHLLARKADAFAAADQQGVQSLGPIHSAFTQIQQEWMQGVGARYAYPTATVNHLMQLGTAPNERVSEVIPVGISAGALGIALATEIGKKTPILGPIVGFASYAQDAHAVGTAWGEDVAAYQGTHLASALVVDTALALTPTAVSTVAALGGGIVGEEVGVTAGMALGTVLIPIPIVGTAVGGLVGGVIGTITGEVIGGAVGEIAGDWIKDQIEQTPLHEEAINTVDRALQPAATTIYSAFGTVRSIFGNMATSVN